VVSRAAADPFLAQAIRVGRDVAGGAMRSKGQATWLADEIALVDGRWQPTVGTLGPDLAAGTAGVGWFLARLAAIADERALAGVATAALRHGVKRTETLVRAGRLDWYRGAGGVAWAAVDAGRALGSDELVTTGTQAAEAVVSAARFRHDEARDPGLAGGAAGEVAALLAFAETGTAHAAGAVARERAAALADAIPSLAAGLANGLSGVGLVLAAAGEREAAGRAFAAERAQLEPGLGWLTPAAHAWMDSPAAPDASWCRGAAGIGLARLRASSELRDPLLLAEAGAAVELVRGRLTAAGDPDSSVCHGAAGAIELLISAGALLAEPAHTRAARTAGLALIERARSRGRYAGGFGPHARNPSLLFGLAGTATLLLRLHDHDSVPSPALPPL
jgi:lantibiotic modifying enzyme